MRTQVGIVGAGPAGLLLSQLLRLAGIDSMVLERRSRDYVEHRIRAGVLEDGTVKTLERAGVAARLHREALRHDGFTLAMDDGEFRVDLAALTERSIYVYGQTELTRDLIDAHEAAGLLPLFEVEDVQLHDVAGTRPSISFRQNGTEQRLICDFIAGCDGFHGVSRTAIPEHVMKVDEKSLPFEWLGMLADVPPCHHELIYANHQRGFVLASMRSATRSRYYIQVAADEDVADWSDARFWDEVATRLGPNVAPYVVRGPALEKSIAPLRSFVAEPMQYGRLFLAGDAAHIVPPTGAKGLNLAAHDALLLADALIERYRDQSDAALESYSARALTRVRNAENFSWWFTRAMHRLDDEPQSRERQRAELAHLRNSHEAQLALAENYLGLTKEHPV